MNTSKKSASRVLSEMGARIKAERQARKWTQQDLAERMKLSQQWVSKVEKDGTREHELIVKLGQVFNRSPAYLQYGIEELANMSEEAIDLGLEFDGLASDDRKLVRQMVESLKKKTR